MAWVQFTAGFSWKPKPQVTIVFEAGQIANVTRDCAAAAVARGRATRIKRQGKKTEADDPS